MTSSNDAGYLLPCSASFKCFDRFSIIDDTEDLEDPDGQVPFWPILTSLLRSTPIETPTQLAELLDTIAVTLRGSSGPAGDYGFLKSFISTLEPAFFGTYWPLIVQFALELPEHFPSGILPVLGAEGTTSTLELSRRQTACLVVHQFLCTLCPPAWREEYFDFSIWYASGQRHEQACRIYLTCLLTYLGTFLSTSDQQQDDCHVTYTLVTAEADFTTVGSSQAPLSPIEITLVDNYETSPAQLGLPSGAAVVSANRFIGFGQSATQEEVHVGSSPASCPAVLITPPLAKNQVLVVRGAEAVLSITGQRRNITAIPQDTIISTEWRARTMLFMDALELDVESDASGLPDLVPENLTREVNKAAIAFSSGMYEVICSPLWGCGAFGGDPYVKVALLWCAASAAHTSLKIICDREAREIVSSLTRLVTAVRGRLVTAQDLMGLLRSIPRNTARLQTLDWMVERLGA
ncbi:poly glycohydrolase-domain-containing protein [Xylaria bambusicola]|uniref:poly glycohydrolase-domain-containing protein n=1 Tax=Xylaria bambusicola TaxID=326684 RepID=UPI00200861F2|nr:poly glycohydrolase-domain-containing protein [Xylaria bambusicola]KAI0505731.1 poly glycohydrolase-domain-containing protein [Xylaria bambusicola]